MSDEYNGWTNWHTWNAYNWLTSDELVYIRARRIVKGPGKPIVRLRHLLVNHTEALDDGVKTRKVNWQEVIDALHEEDE